MRPPSALRPQLLTELVERASAMPRPRTAALVPLHARPATRRAASSTALRISPAVRKRVTDASFGAAFLFACLTVSLVRRPVPAAAQLTVPQSAGQLLPCPARSPGQADAPARSDDAAWQDFNERRRAEEIERLRSRSRFWPRRWLDEDEVTRSWFGAAPRRRAPSDPGE